MLGALTAQENVFRVVKDTVMNWRREAGLVLYRTLTDVAAKASFFVVTLAAARRFSPDAFGLFSLGTTLGWMQLAPSKPNSRASRAARATASVLR